MEEQLNRRGFLRRGIGFGVGAASLPAFLAACGSSSSKGATVTTAAAGGATTAASGGATTAAGAATTAAAAKKDLGKMSLRLSWIKNSEFAGSYMADTNGYYKAEGFSAVDLIAGGPSATPIEVDVQSGKALVGISAPDLVGAAKAKGADLVIIGVQYQKNPFCVMSLAKSPIKTPQEMYGKKFGLQAGNQVVWDAFVKASGIDDSKITKIPAQFDPQPLVSGEADCWMSFVTNEPNLLKVKGVDTVNFLLADFGYPLVSEVYVVKKETLTKNRDTLKAFLRAEIKGWTDVYKDPKKAADVTATVYGKDLGLEAAEQQLEVEAENLLIWTEDTKANGIFTLTDKLLAEQGGILTKAGITVAMADLFDLSLLKEIYTENPELKAPPK